MIKITQCTIELNVPIKKHFVFDNNKIKANEHKGYTSGGNPIHYFDIYCKDNKGEYLSAYTPNEILNSLGTYQVIYN